jgi:VWFA-related protein
MRRAFAPLLALAIVSLLAGQGARVVAAGFCLPFLTLSAFVQERASSFRSGVDLVEVSVVVLDSQRRPVSGLTLDDFVLEEDGHKRQIEAFAAVSPPASNDAEVPLLLSAMPSSGVVTNTSRPGGRLVAILLDQSIPAGAPTATARAIARSVVRALSNGDVAAVMRSSPFASDGLSQGFTADRSLLNAAIDSPFLGLTPGAPNGTSNGIELSPRIADSIACECGICELETIERIAESMLAEVQRQKVLMFIGAEIPIQDDPSNQSCTVSMRPARERTLRAIDRANLTVHVVDPSGLDTLAATASGRPAQPKGPHLARLANLRVLPEYSGGRLVSETNAPEAMAPALLEESSCYYLIGFRRTDASVKAEPRKIKVRVNREGLTVRARQAYFSASYASPRSSRTNTGGVDDLERAVSLSLPRSDISLELAAPIFLRDASPAISLAVRVLAPSAARKAAQAIGDHAVEAIVAVLDADARVVASSRRSIGPAELIETGSGDFEWATYFPIQPGRLEVRVGISDTRHNERSTGSVFSYVVVPQLNKLSFALSGLRMSRSPVSGTGDLSNQPTARRDFASGERPTITFDVLYRGNRPGLKATSTIRDLQGKTLNQAPIAIESGCFGEAGVCTVRYTAPLSALAPGTYQIHVEVSDGTKSEQRDLSFEVRDQSAHPSPSQHSPDTQ